MGMHPHSKCNSCKHMFSMLCKHHKRADLEYVDESPEMSYMKCMYTNEALSRWNAGDVDMNVMECSGYVPHGGEDFKDE